MRKILPVVLLSGALLLGACGSPATSTTSTTSTTGGTSATSGAATSATSSTLDEAASAVASAVAEPTTAAAINEAASAVASAVAEPTTAAAINEAATAVTGPEAATALAEAADSLSAVANDVTLQQGQALVLDASKSVGNISDYKWTIKKAPTGANSVVGKVIKEGSSGNVSIDPADYAQYFPTAGTYTVELTVTDTGGKTSSTDFDIDVP